MDMDKLKCECGHVNPEGTVLCESCGKPVEDNQYIDGNDKSKLLNMRYEGSARRSQTYNRSLVDKIWNFFSSVKIGVMLIVVALIASGLGTIFPQEMYIPQEAENRDPAVFYEDWYGIAGKIYYQLGFHDLYSSWWYMILIGLIGVSLVICSIDRFVPLKRALKMQKPKKNNTFLERQRLYSVTPSVTKEDKNKVVEALRKKRYKITEEDGSILAEKNRFSRWGPYVNHIGLIIILAAALLRMTPIMYLADDVWVREDEEKVIPGTNGEYYIENKSFILETYDKDDERFKEGMEKRGELVHKNYQTDAIIYKAVGKTVAGQEPELKKVTEGSIQMNKPLKFDGYTLYQSQYQESDFADMTFKVYEIADEDQTSLGEVKIDLSSVSVDEDVYELDNGLTLEINQYYPDYELKDGEPRSVSKYPRNPAFVFEIHSPDSDESELSFVGIGKNIDATGENEYKLGIEEYNMRYASGITIRRDYTLPFFIAGAAIFMIGVVQGMYWHHRRIWINPHNDGVIIAAHTNKNWFGVKKDIESSIQDTNIKMVIDQVEEEEKAENDMQSQEGNV